MYNYRTKNRIVLALGVLILFGLQNQVLGFDLSDEISSNFQKIYNEGYKDEYLNTPYSSVYPKDPFGDALKDEEDMSAQLKIAGVEYIENELAARNCSLSNKKIRTILYYFVPEFRTEIARSLKMELGESSSKKFILDEDKVLDYCSDFYMCIENEVNQKIDEQIDYSGLDYGECSEEKGKFEKCLPNCEKDSDNTCKSNCSSTAKEFYNDCFSRCNKNIHNQCENKCLSESKYGKCLYSVQQKKLKQVITTSTPANVKTNCQEFFQINYKKGQEAEQRVQNVQTSQLGSDKYWNATTDDSPYDIMSDLGTVGKLLYQEAEQPITPVIYHLPMFSNSKNSLSEHKDSGSSYDNPRRGGSSGGGNGGNGGGNGGSSGGGNGGNGGGNGGGGDSSNPLPLPLPKRGEGFSMEGGYDELIEGLGAYSVGDGSMHYGSLCEDDGENGEGDKEPEGEEEKGMRVKNAQQLGRDVSKLSDKELKQLMDYMLNAVNAYASLPDETSSKIAENAGDTSRFIDDTTPSELEKTANEIKNCWQSCKGLRIDQEASCMLMCACGEIKSPIFNPEKTPGLGPIFMIRFCTVPAVDTRFALGGKKIISIEEGVKEIYGVVDKLSREGRLGIWTQQYNFLDSTTKKMKVADTVAFSIDIEFVDTTNKEPKHSEQYKKKEIANSNKEWQTTYRISNDLEDPVLKNTYRLVGYEGEVVNDLMVKGNDEKVRSTLDDLTEKATPMADPVADSHSSRYNDLSQKLDRWLDQQGNLWQETLGYINELYRYATALNQKPKI